MTDSIVGIVISIYALSQKKKLVNHGKRILKAGLKKKYYDRTVELLGMISTTFSSFISGQLTEALILGILCFIGMTVFGFKYAVLISTITALFNLIPFVGPSSEQFPVHSFYSLTIQSAQFGLLFLLCIAATGIQYHLSEGSRQFGRSAGYLGAVSGNCQRQLIRYSGNASGNSHHLCDL